MSTVAKINRRLAKIGLPACALQTTQTQWRDWINANVLDASNFASGRTVTFVGDTTGATDCVAALNAAQTAAASLTPTFSNPVAILIPPGSYLQLSTFTPLHDHVWWIATAPTSGADRTFATYDLGFNSPVNAITASQCVPGKTYFFGDFNAPLWDKRCQANLYGFGIVNLNTATDIIDPVDNNLRCGLLLNYVHGGCNDADIYSNMYCWQSAGLRRYAGGATNNAYSNGGVVGNGHFRGVFLNIIGSSFSYVPPPGDDSDHPSDWKCSSTMFECQGGQQSWGGDYISDLNGTFIRCIGLGRVANVPGLDNAGSGLGCFAGCTTVGSAASGTFVECQAGDISFSPGCKFTGFANRCSAYSPCFGGTQFDATLHVGTFEYPALAIDCVVIPTGNEGGVDNPFSWGDGVFGSDAYFFGPTSPPDGQYDLQPGKMSGTLINCRANKIQTSLRLYSTSRIINSQLTMVEPNDYHAGSIRPAPIPPYTMVYQNGAVTPLLVLMENGVEISGNVLMGDTQNFTHPTIAGNFSAFIQGNILSNLIDAGVTNTATGGGGNIVNNAITAAEFAISPLPEPNPMGTTITQARAQVAYFARDGGTYAQQFPDQVDLAIRAAGNMLILVCKCLPRKDAITLSQDDETLPALPTGFRPERLTDAYLTGDNVQVWYNAGNLVPNYYNNILNSPINAFGQMRRDRLAQMPFSELKDLLYGVPAQGQPNAIAFDSWTSGAVYPKPDQDYTLQLQWQDFLTIDDDGCNLPDDLLAGVLMFGAPWMLLANEPEHVAYAAEAKLNFDRWINDHRGEGNLGTQEVFARPVLR